MDWNQAYLDAVGVPRWVLREVAADSEPVISEENSAVGSIGESVATASIESSVLKVKVKVLVDNPQAKFAILVPAEAERKALQQGWKQLKAAWQGWQNSALPASLYQVTANEQEGTELASVQSQHTIWLEAVENKEYIENSLSAPSLAQCEKNRKTWWLLLQQIQQKIELL